MTYHGERVVPRGFARHVTIPADSDEKRYRLAYAEPTLSFVRLYPPSSEDLTRKEEALYWYQLFSMAKIEELLHWSWSGTGGLRNLYLLERKSRDELFRLRRKPPRKMKAEIVRAELASEKLLAEMTPLIETRDVFKTFYLTFGKSKFARRLGRGRVGNYLLGVLAHEMETDRETVVDLLAKAAADSNLKRPVVDEAILRDLQRLKDETESVMPPFTALAMAINIPYTVSPLTVPSGRSCPVEEIDFRERYDRIMAVLHRKTVIRDIAHCDGRHKIKAVQDAVKRHSAVRTADMVPYTTLQDVTLPLLDSVFDLTPEAANRDELLIEMSRNKDGKNHIIDEIMTTLFVMYGAVSPSPGIVVLNLPLLSEDDDYGRLWLREFIFRELVEQILRKTVDNDNCVFHNPLDDYDWIPDTYRLKVNEPLLPYVKEVADTFATIEVSGEEELRRLRAERHGTAE